MAANAEYTAEWLLMERGEMLYNSTSQTQYTPPDQNTHYFIEKIAEQAEEIGKLKEQVKLLGSQQSCTEQYVQMSYNFRKSVPNISCTRTFDFYQIRISYSLYCISAY